jgi:zinc transport system substrate-binding protein
MRPVPRSTARLVASAAAAALLAGCGAVTGADSGERREVVGAFYPLAWVTDRVAGDRWEVSNLTSPGGEPHELELSIDATATLAGSDLVVYLEGFQPAVDEAVGTTVEGETLDAAEVVDLQEPAEHAGEADHSHETGSLDPHFWQDPTRMARLADAVAEELGRLDRADAEVYRDNAEQLGAELEALDREYADGLDGCERDVVVVSHDAFGYLTRYGVHLQPIAGLTPDAEPTPAALAELSELIRDEGITTVFSERLASPAMAETLASDLDIDTGVLDPLEGLTDQTADEDYLSLMRANLAALQEANGC